MRKTTRKIDGKRIVCYEISNEEMFNKKGIIESLNEKYYKKGIECVIEDKGDRGYTVTVQPTRMNFFEKKNGEVSKFGNYFSDERGYVRF